MRPSKTKSFKEIPSVAEKTIWRKDLAEAIAALRDADEVMRFLADVCTPGEIMDIADRWHVAKLLDEGTHSYRDINAMTGISVTTVARVARFLQQEPHQGYRLVLDRLRKSAKS
ncbi:MAG: YerC/YecD family TrpR-related protein [Bdellovibrionales bacterium]